MAKSFFDLRNDIFETLTEASALERRAEREQKQADMAKVAAEQDRKRRRAREARQDYRRDRKRALELESFKVGDTVHLGHGTKGGTGVKGKVHKIDGNTVHIKNDKGDIFKGPRDRVSTVESFDKLTPKQERDAERRLKPTRATVAKVRLRASDDEVADKVKQHQSEKGGKKGNTKKRRLRDLRAKLRDHVELEEADKHHTYHVTNIDYETDGDHKAKKRLPKSMKVKVPDHVHRGGEDDVKDHIDDHISNETGYLHHGYDSKKVKESIELDELKKSTLQSYKDKAKQDKADIARRNQSVRGPLVGRDRRDFRNRAKGVDAATRRLVARQYQPESTELEESNKAKFNEILRKGKKLGDWNMMSYFLYDGNVWMLQSGRAVNQGKLEVFMKKAQSGLINSLKFEETDLTEYYGGRDPQGSHIQNYRKGKRLDTSLAGLRKRRIEQERRNAEAKAKREAEAEGETKNESFDLGEAHSKDIVKGLTDMDGPFTVVAIKNNKVISQEGTKMRNALPAIVKVMRKKLGSGVTISIEDRKGTIRNTFKEEVEHLDELSPVKLKKYSQRATRDREDTVRQGYDPMSGRLDPKSEKRRKKRVAGIAKAQRKMATAAEDVELEESFEFQFADKETAQKFMREISQKRLGSSTGTADGKVRTEGPAQAGVGSPTTAHKQMAKIMKKHGGKLLRTDEGPRMKKVFKEDVEQVDELKKSTLQSYVYKRSGQVRSDLSTGKHSPKTNKKAKGVSKAQRRLTAKNADEIGAMPDRPEVKKIASKVQDSYELEGDQIDELKSSTLRSYLDKSRKQNQTRVIRMADQPSSVPADKGEMRKLRKRRKGSEQAASRLDARKHNLEPKLKRDGSER